MEAKVYSGTSEIINSGVAFVRYGEKLEFLIENLKFQLSMERNDERIPKVMYHVVNEGNDTYMSIKCYNFNDALLNRLNNPLSLARINNRNLTLQFSVSSLNKRQEGEVEIEDMMIIYSWCLTN